ncbi:hypothetical protein [Rummeliibacillus pycnus]|uniref:hypothetical protein n=1 Tax=Rummeliibacillus pycnus TaxID=101070 RepID=UPI0037C6817C
MKKITLFIMSILLFLSSGLVFAPKASAAIAGDIIITKDTNPGMSGKGIVGHTGIYINKTTILHTSGRKKEPWPKRISESKWHERYKQSKVIRPKSAALGKKAAKMAQNYFEGKHIPYNIPKASLYKLKYTYCSQLVWHSYMKAGKEYKIFYQSVNQMKWIVPGIIKPYDYIDPATVDYNGFKFIDKKW